MVTHAILVEKSFVVAGCGDRFVLQGYRHGDLAIFSRIANTDHPRLAATVAKQPGIAAGRNHRMAHPGDAQQIHASLDDVAFRNSSQVDAHTLGAEIDGAIGLIEVDQPIVDQVKAGRHGLGIRAPPRAKIVVLANAFIGYIECASRQDRNIQGALNQAKQFIAGHHRSRRCLAIDLRYSAVFLVSTHQLVDSLYLKKYLFDQRPPLVGIIVPESYADFCAQHWP